MGESTRDEKLWVRGYLDERYRTGNRPDLSPPKQHGLPDTKGRTMVVETSFFQARKPPPDAARSTEEGE